MYFRKQDSSFGNDAPYNNYALILIGKNNIDAELLSSRLIIVEKENAKLNDKIKLLKHKLEEREQWEKKIDEQLCRIEQLKFDVLRNRTKDEYTHEKHQLEETIKQLDEQFTGINLEEIITKKTENDAIGQKIDEANTKLLTIDIDNVVHYQQYIVTLKTRLETNTKIVEDVEKTHSKLMAQKYELTNKLESVCSKLKSI